MKNTQKPKQAQKVSLTPGIQALYWQCKNGTSKNDRIEEELICKVFETKWPALKRQAHKAATTKKRHPYLRVIYWSWIVAFVLILLVLVLTSEGAVDMSDYVESAKQQEIQAFQHGVVHRTQPVYVTAEADGTTVLSQNAPRQIVARPGGALGLSDRHTTITVIQAIPTPVPTPRPRPTPLPTPVPKQETTINTRINGIDNIETLAVLPELLTVDQLAAVEQIASNGVLIAQQRLGLEQGKVDSAAELEYFRIVKSFVLWGFLVSLPAIGLGWLVGRSMLREVREQGKLSQAYKLKDRTPQNYFPDETGEALAGVQVERSYTSKLLSGRNREALAGVQVERAETQ